MSQDCRDTRYLEKYILSQKPTDELVTVAREFLNRSDGVDEFVRHCGEVLRQAFDEVIDMPRTGRYSLEQLEKTEKTYIGTKVEIIFRHQMDLPKGNKLDLLVNDIEVDIKNTVRRNWSIPKEAVDEICILFRTDDQRSSFDVGLTTCTLDSLNAGRNQDAKRTISQEGMARILWLVNGGELPRNFFLHMDRDDRLHIFAAKGKERLARLFLAHVGVVIPRSIIESAAQQKDYMKRIRKNGGARDITEPKGYSILLAGNGQSRGHLNRLGYNDLKRDDFVCVETSRIDALE